MNIADTLQHWIYVPANENGNRYLLNEDVPLLDDDFVEHAFSHDEYEAARPLVNAINEVCGSDIDLGEEDILSPGQTQKALAAVRRCQNPGGEAAFDAVKSRIAVILEEAVRNGHAVWFCF